MYILIFLLFSLLKASCPLGCSSSLGQGRCVSNNCVCNPGYSGADCSIFVQAIQSGVNYSSNPLSNSWKYYSIANSVANGNLRFEMTPAGESFEDCDLYVSFGEIPTRLRYDFRDITYGAFATINVANGRRGTYYIGVVASIHSQCHVTLRATVEGSCTVPCIHGTCNLGVCTCEQGYTGESCDIAISGSAIAFNRRYTDSVAQNTWKYFLVRVDKNLDEMLVIVNITNQNAKLHDCDVFVRKGQIPDDYHWDYQDITANANFVVTVPNATKGDWYIGFWGFKQSDFIFEVRVQDDHGCLSNCSNHGTCTDSCRCLADYNGTYCETKKTPLRDNEEVTGYVSKNVWNYYNFQSNTQQNVIITLNQSSHNSDGLDTYGDCDLYVKFNSLPTKFDFDYKDSTNNRSFQIVIPNALQGSINIGIYGFQSCLYRMRVIVSSGCGDACSIHGRCINGTCVCNPGYSGESCQSTMKVLRNKVMLEDTITAPNQWIFYNFTANTMTFAISMHEYSVGHSDPYLYLYISENRFPTLRDYDMKDISQLNQFHTLAAAVNPRRNPPLQFVVGVYASPFFRGSTSYKIIAWEPDF